MRPVLLFKVVLKDLLMGLFSVLNWELVFLGKDFDHLFSFLFLFIATASISSSCNILSSKWRRSKWMIKEEERLGSSHY